MTRFAAMLALLLTGACHAGSVHPLFNPAERIAMPEVIGAWVQQNDESPAILTVTAAEANGLRVVMSEKNRSNTFDVAVGRIGETHWVDIQLSDADPLFKPVDEYAVRPHFLMRAELKADVLRLSFPEKTALRTRLKDGKLKPLVAQPMGEGESPFLLFTSSTRELQQVIARAQKDAAIFAEPVSFKRKPADAK